MHHKIKRIEIFFLLITLIGSFLFIVLCSVIKLPDWWSYVIFESSPMTWFESVILFTCAMFAFLSAVFSYLQDEKKQYMLFGALGVFFIGLSLDERFALHERIRTMIQASRIKKSPLFFWTDPGDFILITLLFTSLLFLPLYFNIFKQRKSSLLLFLTGLGISSVAILMDSFPAKGYSIELQRLLQYIEEVLETFGMLFFLNSLFLMFTHQIKQYDIMKKIMS